MAEIIIYYNGTELFELIYYLKNKNYLMEYLRELML